MTDLAKLVVKLEAQTADYIRKLDDANAKLNKFSKNHELTLGKIAGAFAELEAGKFFFEMIKGAIEGAAQLGELSKITGTSVESLSKLEFAAKQSGGTLEDVTTGLRKLSIAMSDAVGKPTSDAAIAFKALGISAQQLKDAKPDEIFKLIADRFATFNDGANKNAISLLLFGKSFQSLIPLLDQGSAGIDAMGKRLEELGGVTTTDFSEAAHEFNKVLGEMKTQLVDGLGKQIASDVLPAFLELSKSWNDDTNRAGELAALANVLGAALKGLVTGGIILTSVFQQLGQIIYSVNAAVYDLAHLDFRQAWAELKSGFGSVVDNVSHDMEKIDKLWNTSPLSDENLKKTQDAASKVHVGGDAPNVSALIEAQKKAEEAARKAAAAAEAARKKLGDMTLTLKDQIVTFGLGDAAATEYKLTLGTLADDVEKAGKAGQELRTQIITLSNTLEGLKTQQAVKELDNQIQGLLGHTEEAAIAAFDLANAELKASLIRLHNEDGLARLETLKRLTVAQAAFNEQEQKRQDILTDLQRAEDRIQHSQEVGAINELDALDQLDKARTNAATQLQGIVDKEGEIAKASRNPELIRNAQASGDALEKLRGETDLLGQKMKSTFEDIGSGALADFLDGTKKAGDAVKSFITDLEKAIADFIAKDLFRRLLGSVAGGEGGSGGGLLGSALGFLGNIFGGKRDSGGPGEAGKAYAIGTGAQPEIFVPRSNGHFIPAGQLSPTVHVTQSFYFSSPTDRRTQTQVAAKAASGVANAQRRNG